MRKNFSVEYPNKSGLSVNLYAFNSQRIDIAAPTTAVGRGVGVFEMGRKNNYGFYRTRMLKRTVHNLR